MKQHITIKQLNELSREAQTELVIWFLPKQKKKYDKVPPLLSIGQMIEFLGDKFFELGRFSVNECQVTMMDMTKQYVKPELCDALWEAVKEILE